VQYEDNAFAVDVLQCSRCPGRLRVIAFITEAAAVRRILDHLGLPSTVPRLAPARDPPQMEFDSFGSGLDAFDAGPHEELLDAAFTAEA
jgi:hypothetical protein